MLARTGNFLGIRHFQTHLKLIAMTQELWQQLHTAESDQKLEAARDLLAVAPQHQICWLFEWLAGAVLNKKNAAVPKEGLQLLCNVLDALPESYPLHSHVSWLLAMPLREPSVAPALLERLLKRPLLAFHPSVEQAMAIFQKMSFSECAVRLLLRALESAAPKKAFRAVLDALPVFAGSGEDNKNGSQNEEVLVALVALLVQPQQLPGFEVLANNWEVSGSCRSRETMSGSENPTGGPSTSTSGTTSGGLSHLPWTQIPVFRPGETDIHEYSRKLEFIAGLWPSEHLSLLAPRAAMMCEGSAFQRVMRVEPSKLKTNSTEGVKALVTALGGIWGKTDLEDRFERFERAVFTTVQRGDETHESYLARHDHHFEALLSSQVTMEQLRAYVLLRNSGLATEDKKKLIVDSSGKLDYDTVVKALKLLGSKFFQEVHAGTKSSTRSRTYDINTVTEEEANLVTGVHPGVEESVFIGETDESFIDAMLEDGDPDALICHQFEEAILDVLQNDTETASCYLTYVEARKRLTDRNRNRGFWAPGASQNNAKGYKGRGKGKFQNQNRYRKPLAARILESECRRCGQKGHWKAECPLRSASGNSQASGQTKEHATMTVTPSDMPCNDMIPMDEVEVSVHDFGVFDVLVHHCFVTDSYDNKKQHHAISHRLRRLSQRLSPLIKQRLKPANSPQPVPKSVETDSIAETQPAVACFASHGSYGIVDLGASQSVIGQRQLSQVLESFDPEIRKCIREIRCDTMFRFGNSSTVHCSKAMLIPLGQWYVKLCIVPSETPFLLSNNMFRTLGAQIDTASDRIFLAKLNLSMDLVLSEKKLYLLDFGQLVNRASQKDSNHVETHPSAENIMMTESQHDTHVKFHAKIGINESDEHVPQCQVPRFTGSQVRLKSEVDEKACVSEHPGTNPAAPPSPNSFDPVSSLSNVLVDQRHQDQGESGGTFPQSHGPSSAERGARFHKDDDGRAGTECDHVWGGQEGADIRESSSRRSELCGLVHSQVRPQSEIPASTIPVLHPEVCGSSRSSAELYTAQEPCEAKGPNTAESASAGGRRDSRLLGRGDLDVGHHRRPASTDQPDGEQSKPEDHQPRGGAGPDCRPTSRTDLPSEGSRAAVDLSDSQSDPISKDVCQPSAEVNLINDIHLSDCIDVEFFQDCLLTDCMPDNPMLLEMWSYWKQRFNFSDATSVRRHFAQPGIDLLEVYCSQDSQLTKQAWEQGLSVARFSLKNGDLSTLSGRHVLYETLWQLRPRHLWLAPKCKPWCSWSRLNSAKSERLAHQIQQERQGESVHLLLCDALIHLQLWRQDDCHCHLEQPQGSELVHQREMFMAQRYTLKAICDMCTAGKLHHPETHSFLRKRTQVLTTSSIMFHALEKLQCSGIHDHEAIQGSCKPPGHQRMPLTQYTELYTATFGRKVSRVILCSIQAREKQCVPFLSEDSDVLHAIICASRNEESRPESEVKRRRLGMKSHPEAIFAPPVAQHTVEDVVKFIEGQTPRVGKQVFQTGPVVDRIQAMFPDMHVKVVEACRGVDRKRELPIPAPPHMIPYRKTLGRKRQDQTVYCDDDWEKWDKLSKRQIRRAGIPSKIAITVFADRKNVGGASLSTHQGQEVTGPSATHDKPPLISTVPTKRVRFNETSENLPSESVDKSPADTIEFQENAPMPDEGTCPKFRLDQQSIPTHGPMFRALPSAMQQMVAKVHKNLGHPDVRQLQHALQRNGWSDLVIKAVQDFHCDVCFEKSLPKAPRPAHIHAPREFNDLVVFDGADWSDGQGSKYTFVHFLDTATNFQLAVPFYRQSTEEIMECFRNTWIRCAGPPKEVMFDSQTGFNSDLFARFLQEQSIRSHVIPTGAHWQMGRSERHGSTLLRMLDKYHADQPISSLQDFENALQLLCNAKNSLSRHAGFTPEILVLGKSQHVPGSNLDDSDSAGFLGIDDQTPEGIRFAQQLARREAARVAFIKADHCQALRKAMHARSRPDRMQFMVGDHVMYWRQGKGAEPGSWHGPARIIMLEKPNTIWISHLTRLYRCAPEHVRSVSSREMTQSLEPGDEVPDMTTGVIQFRHLQGIPPIARAEAPVPRVDTVVPSSSAAAVPEPSSVPSRSPSEIQPDAEPDSISQYNPTPHHDTHNPSLNNDNPMTNSLNFIPPPIAPAVNTPVPADDDDGLFVAAESDRWEVCGNQLIRHHRRLRLNRFFPTDCSDIPVDLNIIESHRTTEGQYRDGSKLCQNDVWRENPAAHCSQPDAWIGRTIFQLKSERPEVVNTVTQHEHVCHVTSFEVLLTTEDLQQCFNKNYKQQEAFLASTAKKQRSEVKMHQLTKEEQEMFRKAKLKEVESWLSTDTVRKITRSAIPEAQLLRTRWVLTWKSIDAIEQQELGVTKKPKARLVILGFEDPFIDTLERDSPTLGRDSRMLALQVISSHQWPVRSFDIRTAFLRGSRQDGRILGIEPPEEMRQLMGLEDHHACELLKGAYGLINAPLLWYMELKSALLSLNFVMSPFDPCTFVLPKRKSQCRHGDQQDDSGIHGILGVHVDDGVGGGDEVFQAAIAKLESRFPFGNKRQGSFTFTGIQVDQQSNGDILLSQKEYIQDIPNISIPKERRSNPTSPITKEELQSFRGWIGSLQFAATNTRPDISSKLSLLQAKVSNATVADLIQGNRILEEAKKHSSTNIRIQSIPVADVHFMSFSDAAFATREKANSQKGCLILATTKQINEVQSVKVSPITWYSKKIARVVASTLASETYALSGALDLLSWIRIHWAWLINPSLHWQNPEETLASLPPAFAVVDCKSLYDLLQKTSVPQCSEYRTLLEALVIRDRLREGVVVKWVHSAAQMADALTKDMDATTLRSFLARGRCILHDVDEILKQRSDKKLRQEWYQRSTADDAGTERAAGAEVYQAQLFSCLTKMMAEEKSRTGCCRLLVTFFAALVKAFGRHRAKEQVRQEQREKNMEEKKSPTAVEFLVFVQLWNLLKPWIKADNDAVESLRELWQMVRSNGLYRPREDQKGLQSKTLGACCGVLLKRLENSEQSTAEWACLEEGQVMLQLDVAPFESRLQRFWSLLVGPHGASAGASRLAAKLLGTYAQLADLSSCLETLNDAASSQQGGPHVRPGSPLLAAPEFVQGLEAAARQLTAIGQITGTWKMLLKALKLQLEAGDSWTLAPGSAALLRPVLAGLTPNELCLQPMRDLFHETYDLLMGIQPWPASMDGLLLALCTLGRKLTSWELPSLLSAASRTCERSREGLERLVRSSSPSEAAMHCLRAQRDALEKVEAQEVVTAAIQQAERDFSGPSSSSPSRGRHVAMLAAVAGSSAPGPKRKRKEASSSAPQLERLCALLLPEDDGQDLALLSSETETLLESKELCAPLLRRLTAQLEQLASEPKVKRRRKSATAEPRGPLLARLRLLRRVVPVVPVDRGELLLLLRRAAKKTTDNAVAEAALMCLAELLRSHTSDEASLEDSFLHGLEEDLRGLAQRPVSEDLARALGLCSKALRRSAQGKVKKQSLAQFIAALLGQELAGAAAQWRAPTPIALLRGAPAPQELPRVLAFLEAGGLTKLEGVLALQMSDDFQDGPPADLHVAARAAAQLLQLLGKEVQLQMCEEMSWISYLPDVLRWMKENPGPHLQPLITTLGKQLEGLCKGEGRLVPDEELMDLLMAWAELDWEEENEAQDSFACLELWAKRSVRSAEFLERLSLRICSLPSDEASLRPLGSALARLVRGMRSSSAALVAAQRLLGAAEDATKPSLLLCAADLLLALFARASGTTRAGGRGLRRNRRFHPQLSQLEALLLSCACESARKAPGEGADPNSFLALTTCASKLLSALFKAVPLEAVRLPLWVERPHLLQDAFRPILEAVYAAPTGASACLVAQDLARLWEALSQGGARQAVQSAGRTGLTTYQAKVQRATA
eukprot:s2611_g1.t1